MTTKEAIITLLAFMVLIPILLDGWAHLVLWMGGMR